MAGCKISSLFSLLFCIEIAFIPILNLIDFTYCYLFFFAFIFLLVIFVVFYKVNISNFISLIMGFLTISLISMLNHGDDVSSIINLISLSLVWVVNCLIVAGICQDDDNLRRFVFLIPKLMSILVVFYFFVTEIMVPFGFNDPVQNFIDGERVKLISHGHEGHSVLIDISFIGLIFSMVLKYKSLNKIFYVSFFIILLVLTNTATSWLIIFTALSVSLIEVIKSKNVYIGSVMYLTVIMFSIVLASSFNSSMESIRTLMQKAETSQYDDDFSAGRFMLNKVLIEKIYDAPFSGVGHGDVFMKNGFKDSNGLGAQTESGLRIAAKYGLPMFLFIIFNLIRPIVIYRSKFIQNRILSLSFIFGVMVMLASNSVIEVPHELPFILYIPLCFILMEFNKLNESVVDMKDCRK